MLFNYLRAVGSLVSRSCIGIHSKGCGAQTEFFHWINEEDHAALSHYRWSLKKRRGYLDYMGNAIRWHFQPRNPSKSFWWHEYDTLLCGNLWMSTLPLSVSTEKLRTRTAIWMNRFFFAVLFGMTLLFTGCARESEEQATRRLIQEINDTGQMTDQQAERLSGVDPLQLNGLKSITLTQSLSLGKINYLTLDGLVSLTDEQAEGIGGGIYRDLGGLESLTDAQAESLSQASTLRLDSLTLITDTQAVSLSKVESLGLDGLTSITDAQAESLSRVKKLSLQGLTVISETQAEQLRKVENLSVSPSLRAR